VRLSGPVRLGFGLAIAAFLLSPMRAASQIPPDERYLTFETDHFRVIFPERMEAFARFAAPRAEWAYAALSAEFLAPPRGRISLVITDHTDYPNASATPLPTNRVTLIATPDILSRSLNYYTNWVDVTLVHELAHIFHLDRAGGLWRLARAVFGRVPAFFPAFYQPTWVIEGLPSYYESRLTGAGRAYGSSFESLLTADAAADDFRSVDAADGLAPLWPAGNTPYAYGGMYFRSMAEEFGDTAVARFARRGAARLPYTLNWASSAYFAGTLSGSWKEWAAGYRGAALERSDSLAELGLTSGVPLLDGHAWSAPAPRFAPDGGHLAFDYITPRNDPATVIVDFATGEIALRKRRNSGGSTTWDRGGRRLYMSQVEYRDRYDLFGDLYELDLASGEERRLTRGSRLASPDLAPDGRTLVAVEIGLGSTRLVLIDLESLELRPLSEFDRRVNWERPRWSPDGRTIAAEMTERGRVLDVVVVDTVGRLVWRVTDDDAADVTPAWSPDGRLLIWSSDRDGLPDIYAVEVPMGLADSLGDAGSPLGAGGRVWRLTRTIGGASDPDVSPDGRWLVYAALYAEGYRVERLPFDRATWEPAGRGWRSLRRPVSTASAETVSGTPTRRYSPFPSLWPRSWLPIIYGGSSTVGTFIGATTFGADDVRRHSYALYAGWRIEVGDVEGGAVYRYAGLGDPVIDLSISQDLSSVSLLTSDGGRVEAVERERELRLAAGFLRPRVRSVVSVVPALSLEQRRYTPVDPSFADTTVTDAIAGLLLGYSNARGYARSVSAERGFVSVLELTHRRRTHDLDQWRLSAEAVVRGYLSFRLFGYANHVIAARLAFGASQGHKRSSEFFALGGIPGRGIDVIAGVEIGGGVQYPVRGFSEGVRYGDRIASLALEYRLPLALVGRGYGLWPVMLDRLSLSFFADAGSAWTDDSDVDVLTSLGSELNVDLGLSYALVYRFRLGVARPIIDADESWSAYVSTGIAF
jgi:hypothetical protein